MTQRFDHPQTTKTLPLGGRDEIMIFVRAEGWYPVMGLLGRPLTEQAAEHAALNPGTLRVEDMEGNVLWRMQ